MDVIRSNNWNQNWSEYGKQTKAELLVFGDALSVDFYYQALICEWHQIESMSMLRFNESSEEKKIKT